MKKAWEEQKLKLNTEGLHMIWFYNYYIENLNRTPQKTKLDFNQFQEFFQQFLQMLNINIPFQDTSHLKTLFADGNSHYISTNSIIKKVINYFNNKTQWNES